MFTTKSFDVYKDFQQWKTLLLVEVNALSLSMLRDKHARLQNGS